MSFAVAAERGSLARSTLHELASKRAARPPGSATIEALARAIAVPTDLVREAVAADFGFRPGAPESDEDAEFIWAAIRGLSPTSRRHVRALVESLLRAES